MIGGRTTCAKPTSCTYGQHTEVDANATWFSYSSGGSTQVENQLMLKVRRTISQVAGCNV